MLILVVATSLGTTSDTNITIGMLDEVEHVDEAEYDDHVSVS